MDIKNFIQKGFALTQDKEETTVRFILFLDIMGFKDRVARYPHNEVLKDLQKLQAQISSFLPKHKKSEIQVNLFSDSIFLYSNDAQSTALESLSRVAMDIMNVAIRCEIPLKGALAKGEVTCDEAKQLFFGQALIDAYLLQENTKYYGVVVHHSAEKDVEKLPKGIFSDMQVYLKSGKISHLQLNWFLGEDGRVRQEVKENLKKLRNTVSEAPRKYIDNTNEIINQAEELNRK